LEIRAIDPILVLLVAARWVHFAALFLLFGAPTFWLAMAAPARAALPRSLAASLRLLRIAGPLAAVSGLLWLIASIANMTGAFADLADADTLHAFFFETSFGPLAIERLVLLTCAVALALLPMRAGLRLAALATVAGLLLSSQAWLGHAAEGGGTPRGVVMVAAYDAHVLAAATWLGGLPPLLLVVIEARRHGDAAGAMWRVLSRYAAYALGAVGVILVSGLANTWFHAGTAIGPLLSSRYGAVLGLKVGLFVVMLAVAALNRFVAMPRLAAGSASAGSRMLTTSITLDVALALLVLGCAAVLGITPPPG
jgi:putative copper resistance protein D